MTFMTAARTAAALAGGVLAGALVTAGAGVLTDADGNQLDVYGGALRSTGGVWSVIDDANHQPIGITGASCSATTGNLTVQLDRPAAQVVTAWAETDETLSRLNIVSGASVGLDTVVIRFSRAGAAVPCNSTLLQGSSSNIWIGGIMLPTSGQAPAARAR